MNFVVDIFKNLRKFDYIQVMVDRLTKSAPFIPLRMDCIAQ